MEEIPGLGGKRMWWWVKRKRRASKSGRMSRALNAELRGPTLKEALGDEWAVPWALLGHRGLGDFFCMIFQIVYKIFLNLPLPSTLDLIP